MMNSVKNAREDVISQKEGNIVSDMDGEKVMLSIENGKYYNLGEVGGEIWELIKEPIAVPDLISLLMNQFDVSYTDCEKQVLTFLNHLAENRLIETNLVGNI